MNKTQLAKGALIPLGFAAALIPVMLLASPWIRLIIISAALTCYAILRTRHAKNIPSRDVVRGTSEGELLPHRLCVLLLLSLSFNLVYPAGIGDAPCSWDHTIHVTKAWSLKQLVTEEHSLWGWSANWMAGYPVGYNYPIGGEIWVLAVWAATLGFADIYQAYGIAIWLIYFLLAFAIYQFAARVFTRSVGVIAAILVIVEKGDVRLGGWNWVMEFGVWPVQLSVALALLAVARMDRFQHGDAYGNIASFALYMGAAIITHPLQLLHFLVVLPLCMVLYLLTSASLREGVHACLRLNLAVGLGTMVSCIWLLPFLSASDFHVRETYPWDSWQQMGQHVVDEGIIPQFWIYSTVLGIVGSLSLIIDNRFNSLRIGMATFAFLVLGSSSVDTWFQIGRLIPSYNYIHFPRFAMLTQPYLCIGAAYALTRIFSNSGFGEARLGMERELKHRLPAGIRVSRLLLAIMLTLPILVPAAWHFTFDRILRAPSVISEQNRAPKQRVVQWLKDKKQEDQRFFRVALDESLGRQHEHADLPMLSGIPMYKAGHTPAIQFNNRSQVLNRRTLELLNIRYVISTSSQLPNSPWLTHVLADGEWNIYEFSGWNSDIFHVPKGRESIRVRNHTSNKIDLEIKDGVRGPMRLNMAWFPRWKAYKDGEPVAVTPVKDLQTGLVFPTIESISPGAWCFRFEPSWVEYLGASLFLVGSVVSVGLLVIGNTANQRTVNIR